MLGPGVARATPPPLKAPPLPMTYIYALFLLQRMEKAIVTRSGGRSQNFWYVGSKLENSLWQFTSSIVGSKEEVFGAKYNISFREIKRSGCLLVASPWLSPFRLVAETMLKNCFFGIFWLCLVWLKKAGSFLGYLWQQYFCRILSLFYQKAVKKFFLASLFS